MKQIITLFLLFISGLSFAQLNFPDFLKGTWKRENKEMYERWDKLNENSLKGFSYELNNGQISVSEYLDLTQSNNEITYTATVINQNEGKGISFKLTKSDNSFTFENPNHDFPKRINYQKINENEIVVQVSDGDKKGFSYKMQKLMDHSSIKDTTISNPNYDPVIAARLKGDEMGMKGYILVLLKTGRNKTTDKAFINDSFRGHMNNINLLVKEGKMIVAGPLKKNDKSYRGIFILNVTTFEEAEKLLQSDTAIKEGILDYELYNWFGSAALPEYLIFADKIWKTKP